MTKNNFMSFMLKTKDYILFNFAYFDIYTSFTYLQQIFNN
jgi:hypothetical protein